MCLAASPQALALTDEEIFRNFQFNLINPGARSMGLAGAFVSLADDATAARANPAGLSFLPAEEYFVEFRLTDNAAQSSIRNEVLPAGIRTFVATGTNLDDQAVSSFASYVVPFERWTLGASIERLVNTRNATLSRFAFTFPDSPGAFLAEGSGFIDVQVVNYNISAGFRPTARSGVGITITGSRLDVESQVENLIVDIGANVADREILEPTLDLRTSIRDHDEDVAGSVGLIYKATGNWSVGAVYRFGADFSLSQRIDPPRDTNQDGIVDEGLDTFAVRERLGPSFANRFHLPDSYGAGVNWRLSDRFKLALDVERVLYSTLLDDYVAGVNLLTGEDARFTIDDATDVRLGAEYFVFPGDVPLALRGGVFTESDSTIRAVSTGSGGFATTDVFSGRATRLHGALGIGATWRRFQLDIAADLSETDNEYLISVYYRGR